MIKFVCQHCGRWAEVDDAASGRDRHCPLCGRIISIPLESQFASSNGSTPTFAYATGGGHDAPSAEETQNGRTDSPTEDINLEAMKCGELDETDIMPAVKAARAARPQRSPLWQRALERALNEKHAREEKARSKRLMVTAVIAIVVLTIIAVTLILIALQLMSKNA